MAGNRDWDNAFTGDSLHGLVEHAPSFAGATLATEFLCLFAGDPARQPGGVGP